jgi:hypothetical protein
MAVCVVWEFSSLGGVSASGDQAEVAVKKPALAIAVALALFGAVALLTVMFRLS